MLSRCFLDCSVGVGVFVTGLSQIFFFFSSNEYHSFAAPFHGKKKDTALAI